MLPLLLIQILSLYTFAQGERCFDPTDIELLQSSHESLGNLCVTVCGKSCRARFARESASLSPRDYVIMGFGCCDALGWANQRANQQFHTLTSRPKSYRLYHQSMSCSQKFRCDPSNPVDFIMSLASPILQREVWLNKVLATEL